MKPNNIVKATIISLTENGVDNVVKRTFSFLSFHFLFSLRPSISKMLFNLSLQDVLEQRTPHCASACMYRQRQCTWRRLVTVWFMQRDGKASSHRTKKNPRWCFIVTSVQKERVILESITKQGMRKECHTSLSPPRLLP